MKKLLITLGLMLCVIAGPLHAKDWKEVRIAFDVPYEPFEYKTPDGELTGFEIELAEAVCKEMGVECKFVIQAWDGIIPGLLARKYDAIMSSMSITEERAQMVNFTKPYYNTPSAWFAKKEEGIGAISKDSLKGKVVGVQRGTTQDAYVTENFGDTVEIKRYTTADDLVLDLEGERLDLVFLDYPVGEQTLLSKDAYEVIGDHVKLGQGVAVALRKRDEDLAEMFNKALAKVKQDGTYDKIMNKYFSYDIKM
ncbi:ABC transporter substrate-binding protein [Marinobacteraceae bacterium S3BR75-40.1]